MHIIILVLALIAQKPSDIIAGANQSRAQMGRAPFVWDQKCAWVANEAVRNGFENHEYFLERAQRGGLNVDRSAEGSFPLASTPENSMQGIWKRMLARPSGAHAQHFFAPRFRRFGAAYSPRGQYGPFLIFVYSE
jgi:hypothetical protein